MTKPWYFDLQLGFLLKRGQCLKEDNSPGNYWSILLDNPTMLPFIGLLFSFTMSSRVRQLLFDSNRKHSISDFHENPENCTRYRIK